MNLSSRKLSGHNHQLDQCIDFRKLGGNNAREQSWDGDALLVQQALCCCSPTRAHRPAFWATVELTETDLFAADTVRVVAGRSTAAEQLAALPTQVAPPVPVVVTEPPPQKLYVSGHKVSLRADAGSKAKILDRFRPGEAVVVLDRSDGWVHSP